MSANPWLSNEPDEAVTVRELDNVLFILGLVEGEIVKVALIWDEKPQNVNGGTFNSGGWVTRDLNMENDPFNLVTLGINQITIDQSGTYLIKASCPAMAVDRHQARLLQNGVQVAIGTSEFTTTNAVNRSNITAIVTCIVGDILIIQHQCSLSKATYGFGVGDGSSFGNEIYTQVEVFLLT
jgi:hypothetical protein